MGDIKSLLWTALEKVHMLRCASLFVTATYGKVGLIPHDSRALPLKLFARLSTLAFVFLRPSELTR